MVSIHLGLSHPICHDIEMDLDPEFPIRETASPSPSAHSFEILVFVVHERWTVSMPVLLRSFCLLFELTQSNCIIVLPLFVHETSPFPADHSNRSEFIEKTKTKKKANHLDNKKRILRC